MALFEHWLPREAQKRPVKEVQWLVPQKQSPEFGCVPLMIKHSPKLWFRHAFIDEAQNRPSSPASQILVPHMHVDGLGWVPSVCVDGGASGIEI
jgi:hypothetical protein